MECGSPLAACGKGRSLCESGHPQWTWLLEEAAQECGVHGEGQQMGSWILSKENNGMKRIVPKEPERDRQAYQNHLGTLDKNYS